MRQFIVGLLVGILITTAGAWAQQLWKPGKTDTDPYAYGSPAWVERKGVESRLEQEHRRDATRSPC